jgi:hypothetical protein
MCSLPCCLNAADLKLQILMLWSSVVRHHMMYVGISILKEHTAFIIRVYVAFPEDGGIVFLQNVGTHLPYYMVS